MGNGGEEKSLRTNVVLTGPARSGSTLTCYLLNRLPGSVALHEPMPFAAYGEAGSLEAGAAAIARFFAETRRTLLEHGRAVSRHVDGRVPDDPIARSRGARRARAGWPVRRFLRRMVRRNIPRRNRGTIDFGVPESEDFTLAVKHLGGFTALLPHLVDGFACFAIVRNPLAILGSWNTLDFTRDGRDGAAERLDPQLRRALDRLRDPYDRQLYLLDWFFGCFAARLPRHHVLRYEEIVSTRGRALSAITPEATALDEPLELRNTNPLYDHTLMRHLGARLLATDGAYWHFYDRAEVEALIDALGGE